MKSRNVNALGLVASLWAGAVLADTGTPAAGVVHMDMQRRNAVDGPVVRLGRRSSSGSGTVTETLENSINEGAYMANVKVGTPLQTVTLQLDTGSSDTWMVYTGSTICQGGGCNDGSFDPDKSSTFTDLAKGAFAIGYSDQSSAKGDYFNDVFQIGGATLQNMTMGIGLDTDIPFGLVGVGYPSNEAGVSSGQIKEYANLPVQLYKEGLVNTVAYSMWLNDLEASAGSLLFGGIDTAKFTGPLMRLQLYPTSDSTTVTEFAVALTSVTAVSRSGLDRLGSSAFPAPVVLDSGTTLSFLPDDLVQEMYKEASVTLDDNSKPVVPCSYVNSKGYFSFGFGGAGGAVVNVSMSELVLTPVGNYTSGANKGQTACRFGIETVPSTANPSYVLGDSFLRSAFVVYDLVNNEAALAQTNFNATDSNIVAFPSLSATVPSSTPAPNEANIQQGVVSATPTSYAAAAGFTSTSAAGRVQPRSGEVVGVMLAAMLSLGVGLVAFPML
jgi:hypothetical protein